MNRAVRCKMCGNPLAHLHRVIDEIKSGIPPDSEIPEVTRMEFIFGLFGIKKYCCRAQLNSEITIPDILTGALKEVIDY